MKKIFSAILMLSTIPAFATGVPSTETTADCDNTTLNTYTGTSNLQADWRANTIALHWYSDGEELNNIPTESQSCVYDSTLTPPPAPTKTGYTFKGWRVKQAPACSFTAASAVNGMSVVDRGYAHLDGRAGKNETKYGLTTPGEWAREYNGGILKGIAECRNVDDRDPDFIRTKRFCWCQTTNYTPNGGTRCNFETPLWVFKSERDSESDCLEECAWRCAG